MRLQGIANLRCISRTQLIGQQRKIICLKLICIQLHVCKPVTAQRTARLPAVQQNIACGVLTVDQALHFEHVAVSILDASHRSRQAFCKHLIKAMLGKVGKRLLELSVGIVPHHHTAFLARRQRLRKPVRKLLFHINLRHILNSGYLILARTSWNLA